MTRAIIVFGHGSRDPLWRKPIEAVAQRVAAKGVPVRCAFLELEQPTLATAVAELAHEGAATIVVVPMFLGAGRHAREDLPRLVDELRISHPRLSIELRPTVGEDPRVLDLLADLCLQ
jgi:sirohydrochlorin cobaltochelatase